MLPQLKDLKIKRKKLKITQEELAKLSEVSQSLIAKAEKGDIIPSYDKVKRIFEALENKKSSDEKKAKELMTKKIEHVSPKDTLKKAIFLMQKKAYSQLPVLKNGQSMGTITEKGLVSQITNGQNPEKTQVSKAMDDSMPIVSEKEVLGNISDLLKSNPAVLVSKKGKIIGIITKYDLLKSII